MTSPGTVRPTAVAALGAPDALAGYELAGARLVPARSPEEIRQAWDQLPADTAVVILTPEAAAVLADRLDDPAVPLTVTLPA
ncbi:V-type ATP synthase subunit F [Arthrobacter luteolus]|uniref:V-type ATP synthase subunit F n=1 Tax=Arthrobacter luteolus TaxID=98672 RepID=UPI000831A8DB|nr:V-type ATP synthase subunit F [Arthrobacter luteolus]